MTSTSSVALTLATLPLDIIRHVIRMEAGEEMDNLQSISNSWDMMVAEYLNDLPPIRTFKCTMRKNDILVCLVVKRKYYKHFRRFLPSDWKVFTSEGKDTRRFGFSIPLEAPSDQLTRLFKCSCRIEGLIIRNFDMNNIKIIRESMKDIKVEVAEVIDPMSNFKLNIVKDMIEHHHIEYIKYYADKYVKDELCDFLLFLPVSVSHVNIQVTNEEILTEQSKTFWTSVANDLNVNYGKKFVQISSGKEVVCCVFDPFLRFMYAFFHYFC